MADDAYLASALLSRGDTHTAGVTCLEEKSRTVAHAPSVFGEDAFGRWAERAARFFGTPQYIVGQTAMVIAWIAVNAVAVGLRWDPYPFILLNLAFSTQAAYAAPLILLAQTRQVERDKIALDQADAHREDIMRNMEEREAAIKRETDELKALLGANTNLTRQDKELTQRIETLTRQIHERLSPTGGKSSPSDY
jgi:uncharacterized membrane protein